MKSEYKKAIIGIISIISALIICFILSPMYINSMKEKEVIIKVASNIPKGTLITDKMVQETEVGNYNLSNLVLRKKEDVVGKYATLDLLKDEYILPAKISNKPVSGSEYLAELDGEKQAISITLPSFASGVSNKLLPGDIISVLTTDEDENKTIIPVELKYVKVLAVTTNNANDLDEQSIANKEEVEAEIATTITLLANEDQTKILANLEITSTIHVSLVYRGNEENSKTFLDAQEKIFQNNKKNKESKGEK